MSKGRVYRPTLIDLSRGEKKRPQGADNKRKTMITEEQHKATNVRVQNSNFTVKKDTKHPPKIKKTARTRSNLSTYKIIGGNTIGKVYDKNFYRHAVRKMPSKSMYKKYRRYPAYISRTMSSKISMIISAIKKRGIWPTGYSMSIYFGNTLRIFLSTFKEGELNVITWASRKYYGKISSFSYSRRISEETFSGILKELKVNISAAIKCLLENILPSSRRGMYMRALMRARSRNITPDIYVKVTFFVPPIHTLEIDVKEKVSIRFNEEEYVIDNIIFADEYRDLCIDLIGAIINKSPEEITKELTIILVKLFKDFSPHIGLTYYNINGRYGRVE